ncbi:MAG TPA: hypothetical protein VKI61_09515 [Chitinophagaceae bacterium]|jgi:hypothetical protein|nr:hypothetical protein [Chitinophagaceae bacterium]
MAAPGFTRKKFLAFGSIALSAIAIPSMAQQNQTDRPPALDKDLVRDFVIAGHGNFDKTKQMLLEHPSLLFATWDWGGGDFETALEGAGHVGNKEIANYLIAMGARTNMFVLTTLGKTAIVKPFLEQFPKFIFAKGPHGLTLLHHAQKGGEDSKELLAYLDEKGLKDTKINI